MQPGDEAFVIRRTTRLTKIWKPRKPFNPDLIELGVLRCEVPTPIKPTHTRGEKRQVIRQARARKQ
jgi:hypothetical protein